MHTKLYDIISTASGDMRMSTIFVTSEYPKIVDKCVKMCQDENRRKHGFAIDFELEMDPECAS